MEQQNGGENACHDQLDEAELSDSDWTNCKLQQNHALISKHARPIYHNMFNMLIT
jgi:hypothetical protein